MQKILQIPLNLKKSKLQLGLTISFTLFCMVMVFPLLWAVSTSFKTYDEVLLEPFKLIPEKIMFNNYLDVFTILPFLRYFMNTFKVSSITCIATLVTSILSAYAFARLKFPGRNLLFMLYLATLMVPRQVVLVPNFIIMRNLGQLDKHLSLILTGTFTAYGTFLLRQFFLTIPADLEEAAIIDGCGYWRRLSNVIIPLAKPAMVTLFIITLLNIWNDFLYPLVFINSENQRTLTLGLSILRGDFDTRWNIVMAATLLSISPLLITFLFAQRFFIEGIALSGIKG